MAEVAEVLDQAEREAQQWRTLKREVGYYAVVARPE